MTKRAPDEAAARKAELAAINARVREISIAVYKVRLEQESGAGAAARMVAQDEERKPGCGESMLASRAAAYDPLTRAYLKVLQEDRTNDQVHRNLCE